MRSNGSDSNVNSNKASKDAVPYRKHNGAHQWKDCPENWQNKDHSNGNDKNYTTASNSSAQNCKANRRSRDEVTSTKSQQITNGSLMIPFDSDKEDDNESACSSHASCGELMEIIAKTDNKTQNLHPISITTFLDNNHKRVACRALLDHCCIDMGLISWDLADMLNLPMTTSNPKVFTTANGTFKRSPKIGECYATLPVHQPIFPYQADGYSQRMLHRNELRCHHRQRVHANTGFRQVFETTQSLGVTAKLVWYQEITGLHSVSSSRSLTL